MYITIYVCYLKFSREYCQYERQKQAYFMDQFREILLFIVTVRPIGKEE